MQIAKFIHAGRERVAQVILAFIQNQIIDQRTEDLRLEHMKSKIESSRLQSLIPGVQIKQLRK
jgi:hypothetical protein